MQRLSKYFNVRNSSSGEPLTWPGTVDGFPFAGPAPAYLKQEEYEEIPLRYDFQCDTFLLPDDIQRYRQIKDRIANGWYLQTKEVGPDYDTSLNKYRVFLSWLEVCGHSPPANVPNTSSAHAVISDRPEKYVQDSFRT